MNQHHVAIGILLLAGTILFLAVRYFRRPKRPLPLRGWLGAGVIVAAEALLFLKAGWLISVYFTPIVWTG